MFKNNDDHQVSVTVFKWTLENEVDDPFVPGFADVMRRCRFDVRQINDIDEILFGVKHDEVDEHDDPAEHLFDKGVKNVARRLRWRVRSFHEGIVLSGVAENKRRKDEKRYRAGTCGPGESALGRRVGYRRRLPGLVRSAARSRPAVGCLP